MKQKTIARYAAVFGGETKREIENANSNASRTGGPHIKPDLRMRAYGGPHSTLRAYQHWHPNAAIYTVTYRGRTVWMTSRQRAIWHEVTKYWKRDKRTTLETIAKAAHCSRASVSRFLRRLDLWRFINLVTMRGRNGGTFILTRAVNEPFRKWTMSARRRIREAFARWYRRDMLARLQPELERYRIARRKPRWDWWLDAEQTSLRIGSTDATFK